MLITVFIFLSVEFVSGITECLTTTRPVNDRVCLYGLGICLHGYCDGARQYCVCDNCWTDMLCDKLVCPPECNGKCKVLENQIVCEIEDTTEENATKSNADTRNIYTTIDKTETESVSTDGGTSDNLVTTDDYTWTNTNDSWTDGHVCSETYTHSSEYCNGVVFCVYGKCVQMSEDDNMKRFRCECDPGADGPFCESRCCKICATGPCKVINNIEVCNPPGTDPVPVILEAEEETWYWWVVGVCLGLIVILILALVVLPYWMWRNRVILMMKIVHYFRRYEDDDEREWDAFISYNEKDREYVLKYLYPKLEKELGFKLCLQFRDFIPGDTISNNIIRAVTNSRRTIVLLTPRFFESGFTQFEYQQAQYEMLHERIRIIPILLEDISSVKYGVDKHLYQIINSSTPIKWPPNENEAKQDRFWKRLVLSMPKKRDVEERSKLSSTISHRSMDGSDNISHDNLISSKHGTTTTTSLKKYTIYDKITETFTFPGRKSTKSEIPVWCGSNVDKGISLLSSKTPINRY